MKRLKRMLVWTLLSLKKKNQEKSPFINLDLYRRNLLCFCCFSLFQLRSLFYERIECEVWFLALSDKWGNDLFVIVEVNRLRGVLPAKSAFLSPDGRNIVLNLLEINPRKILQCTEQFPKLEVGEMLALYGVGNWKEFYSSDIFSCFGEWWKPFGVSTLYMSYFTSLPL